MATPFFMINILMAIMSLSKADECSTEATKSDNLYARKFNETCKHDSECADHRLACIEGDLGVNRCLCVRFHRWDIYSQQCVVAENMTEMLKQLVEQYDAQGQEQADADKIFAGMLIAGFMVLGVGVIMAGVCTVIACYRPKPKYEPEGSGSISRRRTLSLAPSSRGPQPTAPQRDGTVDYVPGLFDMDV